MLEVVISEINPSGIPEQYEIKIQVLVLYIRNYQSIIQHKLGI